MVRAEVQEFRPTTGRIIAAAVGVIAGAGAVAALADGGPPTLLRVGGLLFLVPLIAWALFWNPRVTVDDGGIVLVNILRTVRVPWPAVTGVSTRWALAIDTPWGRFTAWAAPAPGRYSARGLTPQDVRHLPATALADGDPAAGLRPGELPRSPSGEAAMAVRQRLSALEAAGHLDNPRLEHDRAPTQWHWPLIIALTLGAAWTFAGLLAT